MKRKRFHYYYKLLLLEFCCYRPNSDLLNVIRLKFSLTSDLLEASKDFRIHCTLAKKVSGEKNMLYFVTIIVMKCVSFCMP